MSSSQDKEDGREECTKHTLGNSQHSQRQLRPRFGSHAETDASSQSKRIPISAAISRVLHDLLLIELIILIKASFKSGSPSRRLGQSPERHRPAPKSFNSPLDSFYLGDFGFWAKTPKTQNHLNKKNLEVNWNSQKK